MTVKDVTIDNFEGINRGVSPCLLKKSELIVCRNLYTDVIGAKTKRPGYATFLNAPDSNPVRNLIYFELGNGATKRLLRVSGTKIYVYSFTGGVWGAVAKTITDSTNRFSTAALSGKLFMCNGNFTPMVYDGTDFNDVGTAPKGRWCAVFNRRIAVWGVVGNPDRLYLSKIDDPTDWSINANDPSAAKYYNVDPDSYGNLTGGAVASRRLTLFKEKAAYRFDGTDFAPVPTSEGLSSQAGIKELEDFVIYPNRAGVYGFIGDKPTPLSDYVKDYYAGIASNYYDPLVERLAAGLWKQHYLLSVGAITDKDDNTYSNVVLAYNQRLNQWFLWTFAHLPYAFEVYNDASGVRQTIFGDDNGNTYTFDSGTADGTENIDTEIVTAPLGAKQYQRYHLRGIGVVASPSASGKVFYDFSDNDWQSIGELKGRYTTFMCPEEAIGVAPRIKIADNGNSASHTIYSITAALEEAKGDWYKNE